MPKVVEFQGKNVDKALERASDELNIPIEKLRHEVVTYGSSGIFGLVGTKKAKIKVFIDEDRRKKTPPKQSDSAQEIGLEAVAADIEATEPEGQQHPDLALYGIKTLSRMAERITEGAAVECKQKSDALYFSITGGDNGVLIGKRGQTLEAIQYLLEKMINKKSTKRLRISVDVEGYLEKRKSNLQSMASRLAEKAKKIKKPVTIGQMNAHDRRIVHIHLKDESGVRTQSVGDGYYRKLMIFPKKGINSKRKSDDE